jgi:Glycosyl hydrolases related to GH101 family, GH129
MSVGIARAQPTDIHTLQDEHWKVEASPATFGITAIVSSQQRVIAAPLRPETIDHLQATAHRLSWAYPDKGLTVELSLENSRLHVRIQSDREQILNWPIIDDSAAKALIVPEAEGLYVPISDPFWIATTTIPDCRDTHNPRMSMPFLGVDFGDGTLTYILPDDLQSELCLRSPHNHIEAEFRHDFRKRDKFPVYEIVVSLSEASPIGPAKSYRDWLSQNGEIVLFSEKLKSVPEANKLFGAIHAYLWGDGQTETALKNLSRLGVDRALLIYDPDPRGNHFIPTPAILALGKSLGYLMGPYDSFENVQSPKTSDMACSVFDERLYKTGGVMDVQGRRVRGFQGHGLQLSSEALKRANTSFVADRITSAINIGANSYFVDSDAYGDFFDDYDPMHPMTPSVDRENRIQRLRYISRERGLILGSESAVAWSVPFLHFTHGPETLHTSFLWNLHKQERVFGGWWPPERPPIFFKQVQADPEFVRAEYDPSYRIPLYQAVFHDSIVATDRWESSLLKFKNLIQVRSLMTLLYGVPTIWNLDLKTLKSDGQRLKTLYAFFSPIHRRIGTLPLTRYEWLTKNRLVQRTQFGDELSLTANFGTTAFGELQPRCIQSNWLKENRKEIYCPSE